VFTSTSSAHGGQESTLLSMTLPLLHHGMLIVGVPYTEAALFDTRTSGSPYGATHLATAWNTALSKDEIAVAHALGARVARIALRLRAPRLGVASKSRMSGIVSLRCSGSKARSSRSSQRCK